MATSRPRHRVAACRRSATVLALLSAFAAASAANSGAVQVLGLNDPFTATVNAPGVTITTIPASGFTAHTIVCPTAWIIDTVPGSTTNPNGGAGVAGSVIADVVSTSTTNVSTLAGCVLDGTTPMSTTMANWSFSWNIVGGQPVAAVALPQLAAFFNTPGCAVTIGLNQAQSMTGSWVNGLTSSTLTLQGQSLLASLSGCSGFGPVTTVQVSGTFQVFRTASSNPITVS